MNRLEFGLPLPLPLAAASDSFVTGVAPEFVVMFKSNFFLNLFVIDN